MSPLDQILYGLRWAMVGFMALTALLLCSIFVLRIILALVRWRQAVLWARMSADQRLAIRARRYVEALRRERD
jgi:ABC-type dipeptide/oligopeptide/nickel transport system permease subunit